MGKGHNSTYYQAWFCLCSTAMVAFHLQHAGLSGGAGMLCACRFFCPICMLVVGGRVGTGTSTTYLFIAVALCAGEFSMARNCVHYHAACL